MKLKKLEISGFKSFPEKSSILFPPGVSAVVGPNGCGKSNIVDALKWAMGEQSVKQLRGKSMEDVIFSGTDGKPPLNMAEVSLTLINDNGSAPEELKDFSEIMVTRQLYRSGESAYYLNKQPCRLKDIHNVFLGSGMGAKSYAVIQQGNIGAITEAGPEERRVFIEEAAGVTRYKTRKTETLRKINSTNQNLLRVTDIIAEVKRQMNSLNRQAKKAERYKRYKDKKKKFDIFSAIFHYDRITDKIKETDTLLEDLKNSDFENVTRVSELDAAIEDIKLQLSNKNQEISKQKSRKHEIELRTNRVENDLGHFKEETRRLENEIEGLEKSEKNLKDQKRKIELEISLEKQLNTSLQEAIKGKKAAIEKESLTSREKKEQLDKSDQELETVRTRFNELVAEEAKYKNICLNATNNRQSLGRRLEQNDEDRKNIEKEVDRHEQRKIASEGDLRTIKNEMIGLEKQITDVQKILETKKEDLSNQVRQVQTLEIEKSKAKSNHITLKKMDDNFEWYKDGVKAIMKTEEYKQGDLFEEEEEIEKPDEEHILGLMADIIDPEPGFETAVEAALGESLQYIIVRNQGAGIDAIRYLQAKDAGRGGFIPLSAVKRIICKQENLPEDPNALLNHISVKSGFENITEALLGHVSVARDMEDAMETWNRFQETNDDTLKTIVTKNGDVISPNGIMMGGSKDKLDGILAKKKEIKELELRISEIDTLLEEARLKQRVLESEFKSTEDTLQKLIEQKNVTAQKVLEAENACYRAAEDLKNAKSHLEIIFLEQEQLFGEKNDIDNEMIRYNEALESNKRETEAVQDKIAGLSEHISSASEELEDYTQRVSELQVSLSNLNARMENSSSTLWRHKQYLEDIVQRTEALGSEITQKISRKKTTDQNIFESQDNLSEMYERLKHLDKILDTNEAEYGEISEQLQKNDDAISALKSEREKNLEKLRQLEVEQSRRTMQRNNISERIEDSYDYPLDQFRTEYKEDYNALEIPIEEVEKEAATLREKIARIGEVNLGAISEFKELEERYNFLCEQRDDLEKSINDLFKVIKKINKITQERFIKTFDAVNEKLKDVFPRLFEGGTALLKMTDPNNPLDTGVEFMVTPPGKKLTRLSLLSGGEKALAAIAFIFSIFLIKPTSFCLMDEIDAPLDEANVYRFNNLLKIIGEKSQIIMITHNKKTMEFADILFGVTMEKKGVSQIVSVDFDRAV